jgi:phospholipid N-methyltransferase
MTNLIEGKFDVAMTSVDNASWVTLTPTSEATSHKLASQVDIAGVRKVLELRSEYGRPKKVLTDPTRYYDPRYYEAAIR